MVVSRQISIDFTPTPMPTPARREALVAVPPSLITVVQAARALGIGRSKAYELISAGELEVVHIGRSARVPVEAIDAFVSSLRSSGHVTDPA